MRKINQTSHSQNTLHVLPPWVSYIVSILSILEKIYGYILRPDLMATMSFDCFFSQQKFHVRKYNNSQRKYWKLEAKQPEAKLENH